MPEEILEKLFAQYENLLTEVSAIKNELEVIECRRECAWSLTYINRHAVSLQNRLPGSDWYFRQLLESLDCYTNLSFKTTQDLKTLRICLSLIHGILEENEREEQLSQGVISAEISPLIEDLETLESGDPPSISVVDQARRDLQPDLRDAERKAVRRRFEERSRASIDKMFERRDAERRKSYD